VITFSADADSGKQRANTTIKIPKPVFFSIPSPPYLMVDFVPDKWFNKIYEYGLIII
jgi:hypothetical protein